MDRARSLSEERNLRHRRVKKNALILWVPLPSAVESCGGDLLSRLLRQAKRVEARASGTNAPLSTNSGFSNE